MTRKRRNWEESERTVEEMREARALLDMRRSMKELLRQPLQLDKRKGASRRYIASGGGNIMAKGTVAWDQRSVSAVEALQGGGAAADVDYDAEVRRGKQKRKRATDKKIKKKAAKRAKPI